MAYYGRPYYDPHYPPPPNVFYNNNDGDRGRQLNDIARDLHYMRLDAAGRSRSRHHSRHRSRSRSRSYESLKRELEHRLHSRWRCRSDGRLMSGGDLASVCSLAGPEHDVNKTRIALSASHSE